MNWIAGILCFFPDIVSQWRAASRAISRIYYADEYILNELHKFPSNSIRSFSFCIQHEIPCSTLSSTKYSYRSCASAHYKRYVKQFLNNACIRIRQVHSPPSLATSEARLTADEPLLLIFSLATYALTVDLAYRILPCQFRRSILFLLFEASWGIKEKLQNCGSFNATPDIFVWNAGFRYYQFADGMFQKFCPNFSHRAGLKFQSNLLFNWAIWNNKYYIAVYTSLTNSVQHIQNKNITQQLAKSLIARA